MYGLQQMNICRKVNEALKDQVDKLWHTTSIYMHPKIHEYGKKLAAKLPGKLKVYTYVYRSLNVYS